MTCVCELLPIACAACAAQYELPTPEAQAAVAELLQPYVEAGERIMAELLSGAEL